MPLLASPPHRAAGHTSPSLAKRATSACRWLATVVTVSAVILLPWIAYLAVSLPSSVSAQHWPLAWAGLDTAMATGLATTGWLALRRDRRVAFCAASTATVLVMDAWFDVCTSPAGRPFEFAVIDMCVELAEAAACLVLAWLVWRDAESSARTRKRELAGSGCGDGVSAITHLRPFSVKIRRSCDEKAGIVPYIRKTSADTDRKRRAARAWCDAGPMGRGSGAGSRGRLTVVL